MGQVGESAWSSLEHGESFIQVEVSSLLSTPPASLSCLVLTLPAMTCPYMPALLHLHFLLLPLALLFLQYPPLIAVVCMDPSPHPAELSIHVHAQLQLKMLSPTSFSSAYPV